jgi:alkylation response protein AidB-like acyl-CoA dehydrogenase
MEFLLTAAQRHDYTRFREFVKQEVLPYAQLWDHDQAIPRTILQCCGESGFTGGLLPREYNGNSWDTVTFGLLNEAFGSVSSSLTGLFTVQSMVAMSILKWGTEEQRQKWLPGIASGRIVASFALTEPEGGSNIRSIQTRFAISGDKAILNGVKKWITFSQLADVFLVFGLTGDGLPIAFMVERDTPGITVEPIQDMMGFRAAHLSRVCFTDCVVPVANMIGRPGFGLSCVAAIGLHFGRISTAWSAAGLIRGCLEAGIAYAGKRMIGDQPISKLESIRNLVADTAAGMEASRLLCWQAACLQDQNHPASVERSVMAKLVASRSAVEAADRALHIWGAAGCQENSPVSRFYRDARIMEIIEGTTQICRNIISEGYLQTHSQKRLIAANEG